MGCTRPVGTWLAAVVAAACSGEPPGRAAAAHWDAWPPLDAEIAGPAVVTAALTPAGPRRWDARLLVRSAGPDAVRVEHGSESFGLRLYRDSMLAGRPAWDDRPRSSSWAYTLQSIVFAVPPGRAHTVARRRLDLDSLPRELAPGRYHAALVYRDGPWGRGRVHAVRAGAVTLARRPLWQGWRRR